MVKTQILFAAGLGIGLVGGGQLAILKNHFGDPSQEEAKASYVAEIEHLVAKTHFENVRLKEELQDRRSRMVRLPSPGVYAADRARDDRTD